MKPCCPNSVSALSGNSYLTAYLGRSMHGSLGKILRPPIDIIKPEASCSGTCDCSCDSGFPDCKGTKHQIAGTSICSCRCDCCDDSIGPPAPDEGVFTGGRAKTLSLSMPNKFRHLSASPSRFSHITNTQIDNLCYGLHMPEMGPPSPAEQAAFDKCVVDQKDDRSQGRGQLFQGALDWINKNFFNKGKEDAPPGTGPGPDANAADMGNVVMWVGLILLAVILTALAVKVFTPAAAKEE